MAVDPTQRETGVGGAAPRRRAPQRQALWGREQRGARRWPPGSRAGSGLRVGGSGLGAPGSARGSGLRPQRPQRPRGNWRPRASEKTEPDALKGTTLQATGRAAAEVARPSRQPAASLAPSPVRAGRGGGGRRTRRGAGRGRRQGPGGSRCLGRGRGSGRPAAQLSAALSGFGQAQLRPSRGGDAGGR